MIVRVIDLTGHNTPLTMRVDTSQLTVELVDGGTPANVQLVAMTDSEYDAVLRLGMFGPRSSPARSTPPPRSARSRPADPGPAGANYSAGPTAAPDDVDVTHPQLRRQPAGCITSSTRATAAPATL